MEIIIENCSSPGAHFSKNTNMVLMKIYNWIRENKEPNLPFIDFRRRLEKEAGINDNNARNIYPLLKNGGLVEYYPGSNLDSGHFFTNRGLAYLKALETRDMILQSDYSKRQKEEATVQVDEIMSTIVCQSLENLLANKELNYCESLHWYLQFLGKFRKINKQEFALMVHTMNNEELCEVWEDNIGKVIEQYRNQEAEINVGVRVRNDNKIQAATGEKTRIEDISYFTAYSFYSSLVDQAGLTRKINDYHCVNEECSEKLDYLLEV